MQSLLRTFFLVILKAISQLLFTHDIRWVGKMPDDPWKRTRIIVFLNHTSLFEWLFAGSIPLKALYRIGSNGYIPVADVTIKRPFFGLFLRLLAPKFLSITREPDHTWRAVIQRIEKDSLIIIFPEGRMKRADGLDKDGRPMTVRGGIADLLKVIPDGLIFFAYSGGLHHVQVPGQKLPNLFRTIRIDFEFEEVEKYRDEMMAAATGSDFKKVVKADLERRRDLHCGDSVMPPRKKAG